MKTTIRILATLLCVAGAALVYSQEAGAPPAAPPAAAPGKVKNVIFLIGDGMGPAAITLARLVLCGADGRLALDGFPATGFALTHAANYCTTDSAAAATALGSGYKTNNQTIGRTPAGEARTNIAEMAYARGRAVGIVTTTTVTHATPAGFYAHVEERGAERAIAEGLVADPWPQVVLGGGGKEFDDAARAAMTGKGFAVCKTRAELLAAQGPKLLGLFTASHMTPEIDRDPESEPSLVEMQRAALARLCEHPQGFFLMVEGGRIDHSAHSHDAAGIVREMGSFDAAVKEARAFAAGRNDTLVLITSDHSTGAPAITENLDVEGLKKVTASSERVANDILKGGVEIRAAVQKGYGVTLTDAEVAEVAGALAAEKGGQRYILQTLLADRVSRKFGVGFLPLEVLATQKSSKGHDGGMVGVFAFGPGAETFVGVQDNTEIPKKLVRLLGWPEAELGAKR